MTNPNTIYRQLTASDPGSCHDACMLAPPDRERNTMTNTSSMLHPSAEIRERLSKVPEVTLFFWIIKVLCTTVGETFADFINGKIGRTHV